MDNSSIVFILTLAVAFIFLRWLILPVPEQNELQQELNRAQNARNVQNQGPTSRRQVTESMIEVVQALAPTLTREQIIHDLNRTGSVELTVERYMETGTLPFPPGARPVPTATDEDNARNKKPEQTKPTNLLERYDIDVTKLDDPIDGESSGTDLAKRKQEMILAARKRLASQLTNEKI